MSSNRSQTTEIQSNEEKSNSSHWVFCIANESYMKKQVELWVGNRNSFNEKYEKTTSKPPIFDKIKNIDILHIYGHGEKDKNVVYHGDTPLSPIDFLKFLKDNKLDTGHKFLEINACYSEKFAKDLAEIAKADFPDMRISGYPGQFVLCQGNMGKNLANLEKPFVMLDKGRWVVNRKTFTADNEAEYYAEKHRKDFFTNPDKNNVLSSASVAISSPPATSDSSANTIFTHSYHTRRASTASYVGYESTARESLPGRESWGEILVEVPAPEPEKMIENKSNIDQPVALPVPAQLKENLQDNSAVGDISNSTSVRELSVQEIKNDDIISSSEESSPPTPRR